jgi:hypothetical protein
MKELYLPPGNLGRMVVIGQSTDLHPPASRPPRRTSLGRTDLPRTPKQPPAAGVGETITTLAARHLPRLTGLLAA